MTDESKGTSPASGSAVPGSAAGDAAPTQAIPRIAKPAAGKTPAAQGSKPAAKKAPAKNKVTPPPGGQTDKGRPRDVVSPATSAKDDSVTGKVADAPPAGGPQGRTLTAADYARTTKPSPATTAVIPAVKDAPGGGSAAAPAPAKDKKSRAPQIKASPASAGGTGRRASLRLTHVEPWSVTRLAFAISVALMIVAVVASMIFWVVLNFVGVWDQINDSLTTVLSDDSSSFDVKDYFGFGRFVGLTLVLSALNVVLMTILATIGAHLYNLAAQLMGGVEVTFSEEK
ncbi:DUF3566 domain-containing protein [Aeromicrobium yanjiei]|uniref:DUF3566 domain-containing protein n=1 Tax=Aeromicrobium yanjiei TaxID=2662028 RepID=UPI002E2610B3